MWSKELLFSIVTDQQLVQETSRQQRDTEERREDESILFFKDALQADFKQVAGC